MGKNLQLRIDEPCHESWEKMESGEQGRFCGACEKVVVDFSVMSDREVLGYLSRARGGVCGRLGTQQLDKGVRLEEEKKTKLWRGWGVLVVALLIGSRGMGQQRPAKVEMHQVPVDDGVRRSGVGGVAGGVNGARQGMVGILVEEDDPAAKADSFKVLPTVVVQGFSRTMGKITLKGGISYGVKVENVEVWKKRVLDSLAFVGVELRKELGVYPNPARRGSAVSLSWKTEPGEYQVGLFNTGGALLQRRVMEVHDGSQVDLLEIPAGLPGGVYFLRAVFLSGAKGMNEEERGKMLRRSSGGAKEITKKIVVI